MKRLAGGRAAVTRVSWSKAGGARKSLGLALARLSLSLASLPMLSGCLVDDPPAYTQPKRTAPRLDYYRAKPLLDRIIVASEKESITFEIPVTSEDAGEGLTAQFYVDSSLNNNRNLPASTLDEAPRLVRFTYSVPLRGPPGCHVFKIRVAHSSNVTLGDAPVLDPNDVAEVYWWANLALPEGQSRGILEDCPTQTFVPNTETDR